MVRLLADENLRDHIVQGVLRIAPSVSFHRVVDLGLGGEPDWYVLEWAARSGYVVVSHDVNTMIQQGCLRIDQSLPMSGLIMIHSNLSNQLAIDDLLMIALCSDPSDWENGVHHLPL